MITNHIEYIKGVIEQLEADQVAAYVDNDGNYVTPDHPGALKLMNHDPKGEALIILLMEVLGKYELKKATRANLDT